MTKEIKKIDGYSCDQFKKLLTGVRRYSVHSRCVMPKWGSEEFKTKTSDEWVQWAVDNYEEDIKLPSLSVSRTWTEEQKKELHDKLKLQPVAKVQ